MNTLSLSAAGEAAWQSLRQHVEWTPGFWLGWVFTDHTPSAHELHQRSAELLRGLGRHSELRQPLQPEELSDVLAWLLAGADGCDGCASVVVVRQNEAWLEVWDSFMLRLNERREVLRKQLQCGLLLLVPTMFKPRSRNAAPDLWSIRSLALDVSPPAPSAALPPPFVRAGEDAPSTSPEEVTLALQALTAAERSGQLEAQTEARIRAALALFAVGRRDEGRELAVLAVECAPTLSLKISALGTLGDLEYELEDYVAAERHFMAAFDLAPTELKITGLRSLAWLLLRRNDFTSALSMARAALRRNQEAHTRLGDIPLVLRDESVSQKCLSDVLRAQGNWEQAAEASEKSLVLRRVIRSRVGDTPEVLRDEFVALFDVGNVRHVLGDWIGAQQVYEESLALSSHIRDLAGDTPESLRDQSAALERVGRLRHAQGEWRPAQAAFMLSLEVNRQLQGLVGNTPQALRDESIILDGVGVARQSQKDWSGAEEAFGKSLALRRHIRNKVGSTPETLWDESLGLRCVGDLCRARGDWGGAANAYEGSLSLFRQVRNVVGDTPETLENIADSLLQCATVHRHNQDVSTARTLVTEALDLLRAVHDREGLPGTVRLLTRATEMEALLRDEMAGRP